MPALTNPKWNAADYAANSVVQQIWARELIAKLDLRGDEHILDVGCGDGKVTAELARAVPRGSVTGMDASPQMIEFAKKTFPTRKFPNLRFRVMDARKIKFDRQFDLVFSNAALHWVDDHETILRGAAPVLKAGRTAHRFLWRQRKCTGCICRVTAGDAIETLARFFQQHADAVFFLRARRLRKMAAEIWFQNQCAKARAQGCHLRRRGRFRDMAAHDMDSLRPARAGKICARNSSPPSPQRYVAKHPPDADGQSPCPHGAAGN